MEAAASATEEMLVSPELGGIVGTGEDPIINADKLSYEIFSILETKFLFGSDASSAAVENQNQNRGKVRILAIDGAAGGGMRGILPGKALERLEQLLISKSSDPAARISDYFDLAAGTGVGGAFVAMLFSSSGAGAGKPRAEDTWHFLADNGKKFLKKQGTSAAAPPPPKFLRCVFGGGGGGVAAATEGMEKALKEVLGTEKTLRDTVKPVLFPCFDLRSSSPLVFSRADALEDEGFDFRLWEVCRATWAEPGRFEPAEFASVDGSRSVLAVDGGVAADGNPTAAAITHVLNNKREFPSVCGVEDLLVLSLGCGGGGGVGWTAREWARPMARIVADGAADLVDQAVRLAFGRSRSSSNYVRIQGNGMRSWVDGVDDSDSSRRNVKALTAAAEEMLMQRSVESELFSGKRVAERTNSEKLDWFAGELVREDRNRGCRLAPTVAFKQAAAAPKN